MSMGGKLNLIGSALAADADYQALTDYKALVCVFLYGGSDSFSMFVPYEQTAYDRYAASRAGLSIARENLLTSSSDADIGFHPLLPDLHNLYGAGDLAILANVGNLITPIANNQALGQCHGTQ